MVPDPPSHHVDIIKPMCGQFGPQMQPLPFKRCTHVFSLQAFKASRNIYPEQRIQPATNVDLDCKAQIILDVSCCAKEGCWQAHVWDEPRCLNGSTANCPGGMCALKSTFKIFKPLHIFALQMFGRMCFPKLKALCCLSQ